MARILVVDDTEPGLKLVGYLVRARGHEPLFARTGEEAIEIALASMPDLIVMDLQMPGTGGYGALQAIRRARPHDACPIIVLTAFAMVGERERAIASGFDGFFSKPIAVETFVEQLEAFLDAGDTRVQV